MNFSNTFRSKRGAYFLAEGALLVAVLVVAGVLNRAADWRPLGVAFLLLALSLVGQRLRVQVRNQLLSASFVGLVLAMTLLGPAPAVAFGFLVALMDMGLRRRTPAVWLVTLTTYSTFPLAGALIVRLALGGARGSHIALATRSVTFGLLVFGVFIVTNSLNFLMIAFDYRVLDGEPLLKQIRYQFAPLLPGQLAAGGLAAILAVAYTNFGPPVLTGLILVLGIFQYLTAALLRSEERADQLEARTIRLASLQLGVLVTLVETFALRDRPAARHAASVARFSRSLAVEMGCSESEQEFAHSAGLLHDIGKFALPDRILQADRLSADDQAVLRRHPQEGATLVGRLDGYGPVADIILYHHERLDGTGYPAGLIGQEIPLLSRIIAVANAYDNLTARDSRTLPVTPQDAMVEMRASAGRALDLEIVNRFIAMLERHGPVTRAEGDDADFEVELAFESRARTIARASA